MNQTVKDLIKELLERDESELLTKAARQLERQEVRIDTLERCLENSYDKLREVRVEKFKRFNDEEYWIFQDDEEDYIDSLICPVVMSASKLRELLAVREQVAELTRQRDEILRTIYSAAIGEVALGMRTTSEELAEHVYNITCISEADLRGEE